LGSRWPGHVQTRGTAECPGQLRRLGQGFLWGWSAERLRHGERVGLKDWQVGTKCIGCSCSGGLVLGELAYPVCYVVDGFGDGTVAGVVEGHGWIGGGGVFFEPAVECQHVVYECGGVALAPGGPLAEALCQQVIVADEGEVMQGREVAAFGAVFKLVGEGCAAQDDGATGLADVFGDTQPGVAVVAVVVLGSGGNHAPEDV
jgi:hypothetical protein